MSKQELEEREDALIRMYNQMDEETDMQVADGVLDEIAEVQVALMAMSKPTGNSPCPRCEGTCNYRRFLAADKPCSVCNGTGVI